LPSLKILALVSDAYGGHGGIAQYNRDVLDALSNWDRCTSIVTYARSAANPVGSLPAKLSFDVSQTGARRSFVRHILADLNAYRDVDAIYCGHINLAPLAWMLAKLLGVRWTLAIYGIDAWEKKDRASAWAAARADQIISISHVTLDRFRSWCAVPADRCVVVPNAIALADFAMGPRDPQLAARYGLADHPIVMTLGRLVPAAREKGFDRMLDVMPGLIKRQPDLRYIIAGSGEDEQRLRTRVVDLGLVNNVIFTGHIDEAEKAAHYRLADAFALPSKGEGFGFVLLEAMACGIPVIASKADGGREAVRDGLLGTLIDPDNDAELIDATLHAIRMPKGIPDGLDHYSAAAFGSRLRSAMVKLVPIGSARQIRRRWLAGVIPLLGLLALASFAQN
jgi:phosphatidyl-myo-inositol dimannoside synthase